MQQVPLARLHAVGLRASRQGLRVAASLAFVIVLLTSAQAQQNQPPVAVNDTYTFHRSISQDAPGFLGNDSDPDGDPISLWWGNVGSGPTSNGWFGRQANGAFSYSPNSGFVGADTFTYTVCDSKGACSQATITFNVLNQAPPLANPTLTVHRSVSQPAPGLLGSATDADGDRLSIHHSNVGSGPTQHGWLGRQADGAFSYSPNSGFVGADTFTYTVCDDLGLCSSLTATFNVINQPPPVANPTFNVHRSLSQPAPGLLGSSADGDGDPLSIWWGNVGSGPTQHGWLGRQADGAFGYSPNSGFVGADTFNYTVCDDLGLCSNLTATFIVTNAAPLAANDTYTLDQNKSLTVAAPGFLGNDSDPDGDPITLQNNAGNYPIGNGTLSFGSDGRFTYTPHSGFTGTNIFNYTICDDLGLCATARITFIVEDPCKCNCPAIPKTP